MDKTCVDCIHFQVCKYLDIIEQEKFEWILNPYMANSLVETAEKCKHYLKKTFEEEEKKKKTIESFIGLMYRLDSGEIELTPKNKIIFEWELMKSINNDLMDKWQSILFWNSLRKKRN